MKKEGIVSPPDWAAFVKTGAHAERTPDNPDWWYVRAASLLRQVYMRGPIGVEKLRNWYGGKKNRGARPERHYPAGGKAIRLCLQQLEKAGLIVKDGKGRAVTAKGQSLLDKSAAAVEPRREEKPKTAPAKKKAPAKAEKPKPAEKPKAEKPKAPAKAKAGEPKEAAKAEEPKAPAKPKAEEPKAPAKKPAAKEEPKAPAKKPAAKEEPKPPAKAKAGEPKEEKPKAPAKEEKPKVPAKAEKPKAPAKEETPAPKEEAAGEGKD